MVSGSKDSVLYTVPSGEVHVGEVQSVPST